MGTICMRRGYKCRVYKKIRLVEVNTPFKIKVCQITVMILSLVQRIIYAIEKSNIFYTEGFCRLLPGLPKGKVTVPFCRYHFGLYLTDVPFVPSTSQTESL